MSGRRSAAGVLGAVLATGVGRTVGMALAPGSVGEAPTGLAFALGLLFGSLFGGLALLAAVRHHEPAEALALRRPAVPALLLWVGAALAVDLLVGRLLAASGHPPVPAEWRETFATAGSVPLLGLALIVVAPVFEELLFRGLLFHALARSRLGAAGAIAITAVLFTLAHAPTDVVTFVGAGTGALLFGLARHHTGSVVPSIAMHMLGNAKILWTVAALSRA